MKSLWVHLSMVGLLALSGTPLQAQEAVPAELPPEAPEDGHAPNIVCDEPTYNFGDRDPGDSVEHTFVIKNDGDLTLQIGDVKTSCGCTVASVSTRELRPGESTEIAAKLSLKNRRGKQRKAITVNSNDPDTPRMQLYMEGNAVASIDVQPSKMFFGSISGETGANGEVTLENKKPEVLEITKVEPSSEQIEAELETIEEGKKYKLKINLKTPLAPGVVRGEVRVHTSSATSPVIRIPVTGTIMDKLMVAPEQIVLANNPESVTRYVVVRPGIVRTFQVESVEPPDEGIEVNITALGSNGFQIRLDNIKANTSLDGKLLTIHTDVEGREEITIPFKVLGQS